MSLATRCWQLHAQSSRVLSLRLCHPGVGPCPRACIWDGLGTLAAPAGAGLGAGGLPAEPAECPVCPQASCSPTSLLMGSTGSTSTKPSECARSRVPSSPPSTSSSRPGVRGWTGAMRAGWPTAPCSTPSTCPASPAVGCTSPRASAAMVHATGTCTALMPSASPLRSKVGAGKWDPGERCCAPSVASHVLPPP